MHVHTLMDVDDQMSRDSPRRPMGVCRLCHASSCLNMHQLGLESQTLDALVSLTQDVNGAGVSKRECSTKPYRLLYNAPPIGPVCRDPIMSVVDTHDRQSNLAYVQSSCL